MKNDPDVLTVRKRCEFNAACLDMLQQMQKTDVSEMRDYELSSDKMMTDLREIKAIRAWRKHTVMVEAMHEFIDAVMQVKEIGMPHGNVFEDSHLQECLEFAKRFLKQHRDMEHPQ
jgi:hypothetical protein